jgi:hypothetical protein
VMEEKLQDNLLSCPTSEDFMDVMVHCTRCERIPFINFSICIFLFFF